MPFEAGPIAIVQLLAPYLALSSLALVPVAAMARSRALAALLLVVAAMFGARFGGEWISFPEPASGTASLRVATWNLEAGSRPGSESVRMLIDHPADLVALEELTPDVAAAIEADPALGSRYPYRALVPSDNVTGIGVLSRFPILASQYELRPARIEARVQLDSGELVVLAAHPFAPRIPTLGGVPAGFDPTERNASLARLRQRVAELDARDEDVLLIGDFNTAPTDPAFGRLTGGLHDAHAEAGWGPGWTWRPTPFEALGIGFLRIDLVLTTTRLRATSISEACPSTGDHCLVAAVLDVRR